MCIFRNEKKERKSQKLGRLAQLILGRNIRFSERKVCFGNAKGSPTSHRAATWVRAERSLAGLPHRVHFVLHLPVRDVVVIVKALQIGLRDLGVLHNVVTGAKVKALEHFPGVLVFQPRRAVVDKVDNGITLPGKRHRAVRNPAIEVHELVLDVVARASEYLTNFNLRVAPKSFLDLYFNRAFAVENPYFATRVVAERGDVGRATIIPIHVQTTLNASIYLHDGESPFFLLRVV